MLGLYETFCLFLIAHWIFDFVFQSRWMADNKSKRLDALMLHVGIYTFGIGLLAFALFGWKAWVFVLVNGAAHFCTDFITSRLTSILWKAGKVQRFFVVVGWDQLVHQLTMAFTIQYFFEGPR